MANVIKKRYWVFEVYPESAPDNWMQKLRDTRCCFAVSPLHEPDGEDKKPHHHCIYYTPGPVTYENVMEVIPAEVPANGHVEWAKSPQGSQRYLIHLDDPEKQQFPGGVKEITVINGFPLDLTRQFSSAELRELRRRVLDFIRDFDITEYSELIYSLEEYDLDMQDYACTHTILFNTVITSRRESKYSEGMIVGEIVGEEGESKDGFLR